MKKKQKLLPFIFTLLSLISSFHITGQSVMWPGDVTNNGEVDMVDLLLIGRANGTAGLPRNIQGFPWMAMNFDLWNQTFANGNNYGFADSDGNGFIDSIDIYAVDINYGKTHDSIFPDQFNPNPNLDTLTFTIDSPNLAPTAGAFMSIPINLNFPSGSSLEVHGMILTLTLDSSIVDMDFISMDFANSIFNAQNTPPFSLLKVDGDKVIIGIAKSDQMPVMNSGPIGSLQIIIEDDVWITNPDPVLTVSIQSATLVDNDLMTMNYEGTSIAIPIDQLDNTREIETNDLLVYPNPATDQLIIESRVSKVMEIEIFDLLGRKVLSYDNKQSSYSISNLEIGHLNPGLHTIFIHTDEGILQRKFIKQ